MTIRRIGIAVLIGVSALLCSCSARPGGGAQTASAASTGSAGGCEVDAKKVCQQFKDKPRVVDSRTGQILEGHALEDSGYRTLSITHTYQIPNGSVVEVNCEVNAVHNSVVYAHTLRSPALSETDIQFLRSNDLCEN